MDFKRANTEEQKEMRRDIIIDTAVKLYIEEGFNQITFAKIAEYSELKRTVIYGYYNNPADILLDYIGRKLDDMNNFLLTDDMDINPIFRIVGLIDLDHELKQVGSIFSSVLEPASSDEHLYQFRKRFKRFSEILGMISMEYDPDFTEEEYAQYFASFQIMFVGVTSLYAYDKRVRDVCDRLGTPYFEIGICEAAMLVYADTRTIHLALPYWKEVKKIVDRRKSGYQGPKDDQEIN